MNKVMLRKLEWRQCIPFPYTLSILPRDIWGCRRIATRMWPWLMMPSQKNILELKNTTTGHVLSLPTDSIFEFRENIPGREPFLILKSQIFITARDAWIEPIIGWRPSQAN